MEKLVQGMGWYVAFLISVTCHEAAHALAALKLGDRTAYNHGQVTLDPVPHMRREPWGMVIIPILSFAMGGWMMGWGSAPYDPRWAMDNPKRSAVMALAGPCANLMIVALSSIMIRLGLWLGWFSAPDSITFIRTVIPASGGALTGVASFLSILFTLNLILFFFNLLPVPPLDGSAFPLLLLNRPSAQTYLSWMSQPVGFWIGILVAWRMFDVIFPPLHGIALNILYLGIAQYG